jgi:hypothetical protein
VIRMILRGLVGNKHVELDSHSLEPDYDPGKFDPNPLHWFTAKGLHKPGRSAIVSDDGLIMRISDEYRKTGESEGWLEYTGYYRDSDGVILTFRLVDLPKKHQI